MEKTKGRPLKRIDPARIEKVLAAVPLLTADELAGLLNVSRTTLWRRCRSSQRVDEAIARGRARWRVLIRKRLFELLLQTDDTMAAVTAAIFLAKVLLGYSNNGPIGGEARTTDASLRHPRDFSKLTDAELRTVRDLARKAAP